MNERFVAAIFDVDGTLIAGDSFERIFMRFLWRRGELTLRNLARFLPGTVNAVISRVSSLKANKGYLRGKDVARMRRLAHICFEEEIAPRLLTGAIDRLRWHQSAGHFVLLLSGTLDVLLEPLAEYLGVSARIGTDLKIDGRSYTGEIAGLHPFGEAKADCLKLIDRFGLFNLERSFAYADAYADRHLLVLVGNPMATNADRKLRLLANCKGWAVEDFRIRERSIRIGEEIAKHVEYGEIR